MVCFSIEFRTNVDLLKQLHGKRDNITLNRKYSDYKPSTRNNIQAWARSVFHIILGGDVKNLLNDVLEAEGVAKFYPFNKVSEYLLY